MCSSQRRCELPAPEILTRGTYHADTGNRQGKKEMSMKHAMMTAIAAFTILAAACGQGNVFSLEVGTCFDDEDSGSGEVSDVPIVDCSDPHDNEVYYLFDMPDGDFPGSNAIEEQAIDGCLASFDSYVGRSYETSVLDIAWITPTEPSWDGGDREIVCILYDLTLAKLMRSMQGSGV